MWSAWPIATALYIHTGTFEYAPRAGALGPEAWPRLAILLMGASCLYELTRRLFVANKDATGFLEAFEREDEVEEPQPVYPRLVIGGIVLMAHLCGGRSDILGFILGTFLFLAAFMYVGGYRAHGVVWGASAAVTISCGILFLRIAYVSLPRGIAPFDRVTDGSSQSRACGERNDRHPHPARPAASSHCMTPLNLHDAVRRHRHRPADRRAARPDAGDGRRPGAALHLQDGRHAPRSSC